MVAAGGRGVQLLAVDGFFLALSSAAIILRVYCRAFIVKSFGFDDWFAVVAWIFFVLFGVFSIAGVHHGTGQRMGILPMSEFPVAMKWWWGCECVYILSNMALKLSIGIMLLRLTVKDLHRILIHTILAITTLYSIAFFFMFIFQCLPPSFFWSRYDLPAKASGSCMNPVIIVNMTYGWSAISCAGDWMFAIIPVMIVWKLQMNPRTKISVILILSVGVIASAATIVRLPYIHTLSDTENFLYATVDVAIWSCAETGLGIAACSMATLRPLFRAFLSRSKLLGGSTSTNKLTADKFAPPRLKGLYVRSKRAGTGQGTEDIGLRSDIGVGRGVVTVIEFDDEINADGERGRNVRRFGSQKELKGKGGSGWRSSSESKRSVESTDREVDWVNGIRKTTVSEQVIS